MQYGLIQVLNNQQLDAQAAEASKSMQPGKPEDVVSRLSSYIWKCWESAKAAKTLVAHDMLDDLRRRNGEYDPTKLAAIRKQGGAEIYMQLTNQKCRGTESWLFDVLFQPGTRPFQTKSTPVPDLPPRVREQLATHVAQEAMMAIQGGLYVTPQEVFERARDVASKLKERIKEDARLKAERMSCAIDDVLVEGEWHEAMEAFIRNMVTFPAGILKGPSIKKSSEMSWQEDPVLGDWSPQVREKLTPFFYAPSPFDIYPAPDSRGPGDGFVIERRSIRRREIFRMIGVPGYSEEAIRAALNEYRAGYSLAVDIDQLRRNLEETGNYDLSPDKTLDVIEFHGSVPGQLLIEWGMDTARIDDPNAEYAIQAMQIGRHTIRCVLNEDPMGACPYMVASFDPTPDSWWGRGVPRILKDIQDICNATARAMVNNLGLSSGPMVEVEVDRLSEGEDVTGLYPWRIFQTKSSKTTPAPAVRFHNVPNYVENLMRVYQFFSQLADSYAGIQSYDTGSNPKAGAAATASGLSMLMSASNRQMKRILMSVDAVIRGSVQRVHTHIMLHGDDPEVKGDAKIEATGAASLVAKEQQQLRKVEFLAATNNPMDAQILGPEGRAELLRDVIKTFDLNPERVIPDRDALRARLQAAAMAAVPENPEAPAGARTENAAGQPAGGADTVLF